MTTIEQLTREVNELKAWKQSLESSNSIPLNIDQSFRGRFKFASGLTLSSHTGETKTVNEAGATTYSVANSMDGFVQMTLASGTTIYIPYYT